MVKYPLVKVIFENGFESRYVLTPLGSDPKNFRKVAGYLERGRK